jgi:hypothetical protein
MIEAIVWYQHLFPHTYRSRRRPRGVKKRFNKKGFPSGFPRLPLLGSCFLDNCFGYDLRKGFVGVFGLQLFRQVFRNPQFFIHSAHRKSFMRLEFLTFTQETVKLTVKTKKKANSLSKSCLMLFINAV